MAAINVVPNMGGLAEKTATVDDDLVIIEDSADSYSQKKVKTSSINIPAENVDIADAGNYYTGTEVETALEELGETKWTAGYDLQTAASLGTNVYFEKTLTLTTKATYYLNIRTTDGSLVNISLANNTGGTVIKAVCAYL